MSQKPEVRTLPKKRGKNVPIEIAPIVVTKDDVVTVVVSEYEENLEAKDAELGDLLNKLLKDHEALKKELVNSANKAALAKFESKAERVLTEMRNAFSSWAKATFKIAIYDQWLNAPKESAKVHIFLYPKGTENWNKITVEEIMNMPAEVMAVHTRIEETSKAVAEVTRKRMDIRKSLGRINRIERKARANLIREKLGDSEEGRKLIAAARSPKALPGMVDAE